MIASQELAYRLWIGSGGLRLVLGYEMTEHWMSSDSDWFRLLWMTNKGFPEGHPQSRSRKAPDFLLCACEVMPSLNDSHNRSIDECGTSTGRSFGSTTPQIADCKGIAASGR
jgi:hypothetical protein